MSIMSDKWIRTQALEQGMIEPFVDGQRREGTISYGLSSYGYDARVSDDFKIFTNVDNAIVDPKDFAHNSFVDRKTPVCIIPPNSFALARTVEYFRVPRDVLVICLGKSTYARCGIIVNVTPLEPGWEGHVTLEFSNTTPLPARIYANEGACLFPFYIKLLVGVPAADVLAHRILWSAALLVLLVTATRRWREVARALATPS